MSGSDAVQSGEIRFISTASGCSENSASSLTHISTVSSMAISSSVVTGSRVIFEALEKKRARSAPAEAKGPLRNVSKFRAAWSVPRKWPLAGASHNKRS